MGKKAMLPETKGLMFCILAIRFCTCYNRTRLFEGSIPTCEGKVTAS